MSLRYIMTTHRNRDGVRLSKPGHWTNEPFENSLQATAFAAKDANGRPFTIDEEIVNKLLPEFRP